MGTNFYLHHIPTAQQRKGMFHLLMRGYFDELKKLLEDSTVTYHIGKRSGGWQFLFAPHSSELTYEKDNPWENTLESIKEVLSNPEYSIRDENGKSYTPEMFWKEIEPCLYNSENAINGKQYDEKELFGFACAPYEFTTEEGLRFATQIDFA